MQVEGIPTQYARYRHKGGMHDVVRFTDGSEYRFRGAKKFRTRKCAEFLLITSSLFTFHYAREDDITHGCEQMETIMAYAMKDRGKFINQVFGLKNFDSIDLFCCVVAKHNIRTQNNHVPVIDIKKLKELFKSLPTNSIFHTIRNHQYEIELPEFAKITHQNVLYGGFNFKIPAICFEI